MRNTKTGRRASELDRKLARYWVNEYRQAQALPGGRRCVNPEDDEEARSWLDGNCPELLLDLLEHFAEEGTFADVGEFKDGTDRMLLRASYRTLREAGLTHEGSINKLADEYHYSTRTIERKLATDKP
jgi:hypothetical protein